MRSKKGNNNETTHGLTDDRELDRSEIEYRRLFDVFPLIVTIAQYVLDEEDQVIDYIYESTNLAGQRQMGLGPEQIRGMRASEVLSSDDLDRYLSAINEMRRTNKPITIEHYLEKFDRYFLNTFAPFTDEEFISSFLDITTIKRAQRNAEKSTYKPHDGNVVNSIVAPRDISHINEEAETLKESEERLRLAQDVARVGTFEWNIQTGVDVWTPELEAMYGLPPGGFPGTHRAWQALVHPADREEAIRRVNEAIDKGSFEGEWRVVWPDGSVHWLQGRGRLFKDEKGEPLKLIGVNIDITERKLAEKALKESAEAARRRAEEVETLMDIVPAAIWVAHDPECRVITGNRAADTFYESKKGDNVSAGPSTGEGWDQTRRFFRDGRELQPEELPMQEAAAKGVEVRDSELEVLLPSGQRIVMLGNARPLFNDRGETRGSVASFIDITERKRTEKALLDAKIEWEQTFDHIPDLIAILDADQNIVRANKAMLEHMGSPSPEQYVGLKCFRCVHGTNCPPSFCPHVLTLADGKEHVAEVHEEGLGGDYLVSTTPIIDNLGKARGTVHVARNITDLKKSEEALRQGEAKYRGLFENIKEGVSLRRLIYNGWGEIIDAVLLEANPAALKAYGASSIEDLRCKSFYDIASPNMAVAALDAVRQMKVSGEPITVEEHSDISNRDYQITTSPLGKDLVITTSVDITERKHDEESIKRSNEELQQFAYVASHDLQEPLRMITSYLGLLEKRYGVQLPEQARTYMHFAMNGSLRMKELIDDLLQYSRIDSKPIDLEEVDMNDEAEIVLQDLRSTIEENGAEVIVNTLPTIHADKTQMKQLLTNLISNAVKFHDEQSPRVEVSAITFNNEFVFSVKDNGIGIDPKHADKLFKMFSRLHTREEYPGTGIGLAITKKIVERHGGRIWFESEPGKGTTFFFTISRTKENRA